MHVLHFIAVEADSAKRAFSSVKNQLEEKSGNFWSDWHVVGKGRWGKGDEYNNNEKDVISYVNNKKEFEKALQYTKDARKQEAKQVIGQIKSNNGEANFLISALSFAATGECSSLDMNTYYFLKIAQMMMGEWNSDSFFYDMEAGSCSYEHIQERIVTNPEQQYLVPVDFHF